MAIKPLEVKIECNGIKPTKAEVYTLVAELVDSDIEANGNSENNIISFRGAVISALRSYDYEYEYYYNYDNYYDYEYEYDYDYYEYYDYHNHNDYYEYEYYDYYDYTKAEKVIALLFLAAMYS